MSGSSHNTQSSSSNEDKFLGKMAKDNKLSESMTDKDSKTVTATVKDLEDKAGK